MNPYYQNWNYGYTLGAATEASRGAYTTYGTQSGGANPANLATPSTIQVKTEPGLDMGWAQVKGTQASNPPKAQVFVTASPASVKSEMTLSTTARYLKCCWRKHKIFPNFSCSDWAQPPTIGHDKPQAIVNPTQVGFVFTWWEQGCILLRRRFF